MLFSQVLETGGRVTWESHKGSQEAEGRGRRKVRPEPLVGFLGEGEKFTMG